MGVERIAGTGSLDSRCSARVALGIEHDFLLFLQDQGSLGTHDDLAITAVSVPVDRGIRNDDFLVWILLVAWDSLEAAGLAIAQIEFLVVLWTGELVGAIDVVFGIAISREDMTSADGVDGQWVGLFPVGTQGAAEDGRRIELMASEFTHQAGTCPIEQSPSDKFLHG